MIKRSGLYLSLALVFCASAQAKDAAVGAELYSQNCLSCHGGGQAMTDRIAPPIVAVKKHYTMKHSNQDSFENAVVQWVLNPSKDTSLMKGAVNKFGLMPALALSNEDIAAIAEFLYEETMEKPGWFDKHYKAEHGTKSE